MIAPLWPDAPTASHCTPKHSWGLKQIESALPSCNKHYYYCYKPTQVKMPHKQHASMSPFFFSIKDPLTLIPSSPTSTSIDVRCRSQSFTLTYTTGKSGTSVCASHVLTTVPSCAVKTCTTCTWHGSRTRSLKVVCSYKKSQCYCC